MTITDKHRKLLWGLSGFKCAYCKCDLLEPASGEAQDSIIGDECHIVARHPDGPRGDSSKAPEWLDDYTNLILLCKNHHKMIDDQPQIYTIEILHKLKNHHERWVRERLKPHTSQNKPQIIELPRIEDAKEIVSIISAADSYIQDYETPDSEYELELIKDFIGEFEGISVLSTEPLYIADVTFQMKKQIARLEEAGYYIYGKLTQSRQELAATREILDWKMAFIVMKRFKQPSILIQYNGSVL